MAPEITDEGTKYDGNAVDVFALGVTIFYLSIRTLPFDSFVSLE